MNGSPAEVHAQLLAACSDLPELRLHAPGQPLSAPGVVVLPPRLRFDGAGADPDAGTWQVVVFVDPDERAVETLFALLPAVTAAVDRVQDAVVTTGEPGLFGVRAGDEFPSYTLEIEV